MGKEIFLLLDGEHGLGFPEPPSRDELKVTLRGCLSSEVLRVWEPHVSPDSYRNSWPMLEAWFELKRPDLRVDVTEVTQLLHDLYSKEIAFLSQDVPASVIALQNVSNNSLVFVTVSNTGYEIAQSATTGTGFPDGALRELDAFEGQDLSALSKREILERLLYNSEGVFVDSEAFAYVSEDDFGDLYVSWFTEDGLEYTVKIDSDSLKDAESVSPVSGMVRVKDVDGRDVTLQILGAKDLSAIAALEQFVQKEKEAEVKRGRSVQRVGTSVSPPVPDGGPGGKREDVRVAGGVGLDLRTARQRQSRAVSPGPGPWTHTPTGS